MPVINNSADVGVTQRAVQELYDIVQFKKENEGKHISIYISFLQIYNEKVFDLLNLNNLATSKKKQDGLRIRWNRKDQF